MFAGLVLLPPGSASAVAASQSSDCLGAVSSSLDSLATRRDTLDLADRILKNPPGGKRDCGRFVAGYLLAMASSPADHEVKLRQRALELLQQSLRGHERDARYFVALGYLHYNRGMRVDAGRVLARVDQWLDVTVPPLKSSELAAVSWVRGMMAQDEWRDFRVAGTFNSAAASPFSCSSIDGASQSQGITAAFMACPIPETANSWVSYSEMRYERYKDLTKHFEAAFRADPGHLPSARALLEEYLFLGEFDAAQDIGRRALKHHPDDPGLLAASAAVLKSLRRDTAAERTFRQARELMSTEALRVYDDITPLIRRSETKGWRAADSGVKVRLTQAFWNSLDPLYITPYNERRLEHWARVATADLLFGVPTTGLRGWDTDAGQIWIRYGRPQHIREERDRNGYPVVVSYWTYSPSIRFVFTRPITYRRYRFTEDAQTVSEELKQIRPHGDWRMSVVDTVLVLDRQIVRLRAPDGRPQMLIYAPWPPGFGRGSIAGLTVFDWEFQPTAQWRGHLTGKGVGAEVTLYAGSRSVALEIFDESYGRMATARDTFTTRPAGDTLVTSDILVAMNIDPRSAGRPTARADLDIDPAYGLILPAAPSIALYWETYGLTPDSTGVFRYEITLDVRRGQVSLPARILRSITGRSDQTAAVRYEGTALPSGDGRVVEWLEFAGASTPGEYRLSITVRDRVSGRTARTERSMTVK